jgi:hypothetical protein
MTMSYLMNCPHMADGHCLECVVQEYTRTEAKLGIVQAELAETKLASYEHTAVLADPYGLMVLLNHYDTMEASADVRVPGDRMNRRRAEIHAVGRKIIQSDPDIWSDEILRAFGFCELAVNRRAERIGREGGLGEPGVKFVAEGSKLGSLANEDDDHDEKTMRAEYFAPFFDSVVPPFQAFVELDLQGNALPEFKPKVVVVIRGGEVTYACSNIEVEVIIHDADEAGYEKGEELLALISQSCNECDLTDSSEFNRSAA